VRDVLDLNAGYVEGGCESLANMIGDDTPYCVLCPYLTWADGTPSWAALQADLEVGPATPGKQAWRLLLGDSPPCDPPKSADQILAGGP
jgi:hypothetical protein